MKRQIALQDPHIAYPSLPVTLAFSDYIAMTRDLLLQHGTPATFIDRAAPFDWPGTGDTGVLLLHGLLDTAFTMRDLGHIFQEMGMPVRATLLPGHGIRPGALRSATAEHYQQTAYYGLHAWPSHIKKVILVGFSTGALLAHWLALQDTQHKILACITLAPALKIRSPFASLSRWHKQFGYLHDRLGWFIVTEEYDPLRYRSIPLRAIYEVMRLGETVGHLKKTCRLHCPLFLMSSLDDTIISTPAALKDFMQQTHPASRAILYSAANPPPELSDARIEIRNSRDLARGILHYSHVALPISPDNVFFGEHGSYQLASHIDPNKYILGENGSADYLRAQLSIPGQANREFMRLTFNPDFAYMREQIRAFTAAIRQQAETDNTYSVTMQQPSI